MCVYIYNLNQTVHGSMYLHVFGLEENATWSQDTTHGSLLWIYKRLRIKKKTVYGSEKHNIPISDSGPGRISSQTEPGAIDCLPLF